MKLAVQFGTDLFGGVDLPVTISETIREQLAKALATGRTLHSITIESGVHWGHLGRFLRGQRGLSGRSLDRLAEVLGVVAVVRRRTRRHS